jgi:hypothetical protein
VRARCWLATRQNCRSVRILGEHCGTPGCATGSRSAAEWVPNAGYGRGGVIVVDVVMARVDDQKWDTEPSFDSDQVTDTDLDTGVSTG